MKVTLRTIAGLLSSAVLVSCSNVSDDPDISQASIEFGTTVSRATVGSKDDLSSFSVWGGYDEKNNLFKKTTVYNNGTYEGGTRYWVPNKTFNFYAVHPVLDNANVEDNGNIIIENFDCSATGANAVDLMIATAQRTTNNPMIPKDVEAVPLTFNHELAKVNFTVKSENTVATVSSFKVYGVNYKGTLTKDTKEEQTTTWDLVTTCNEGNTPFTYTQEFTLSKDNWEKDIFGDVLLIPDDDLTDANLKIIYKYPDETTSRTSTVKLNTTISGWEAGKSYKYTIAIKGGSLSVNVNVNPWDSKDTSVSWE